MGRRTVETAEPTDLELFQATIANIAAGLDAGEITAEEAAELELQAVGDLRERAGDTLGLGEEDDDDDEEEDDEDDDEEEYASGTDIATFASSNDFGNAILELGANEGYEAVEDLAEDLANAIGLDPDDAIGLITGQLTPEDFEDPELVTHSIASVFGPTATDDNLYQQFMGLALEEDPDEDPEAVQYSRYLLEKDRQIENLNAEFSSLRTENAIRDELSQIDLEAEEGVAEGWLPPVARDAILGSFQLDQDRLAMFSEVCTLNEVSPDIELYAMRKQLEAFRRCGPIFAQFGAVVQEPLTPQEEALIDFTQSKAKAYVSKLKLR